MKRPGSTPQPRLAHVASAIGDPARAAMLARLLDGRYHTAAELAQDAGVAASTASQHLAILLEAQLVRVRPQGRHRYFMLSDGDVAQALEALLRVAAELAPEAARWEKHAMLGLRTARCCYGHLAGQLGVRLHDAALERGWLVRSDGPTNDYVVTDQGAHTLRSWGVRLPERDAAAPAGKRRIYGCVDWSERREHLAGPLAAAVLDAFVERRWLVRGQASRELRVTPAGVQALSREIGFRMPRN